MGAAWAATVAHSLKAYTDITSDTTLAAFGGAGPFIAFRKIAEATGVSQIVIPGLAAVFSAFGIGFSDVAHEYETRLPAANNVALKAALEELAERARRGMFAEGFDLADCTIGKHLQVDGSLIDLLDDKLPSDLSKDARLTLVLKATKTIAHAQMRGRFGGHRKAALSPTRRAEH